MNTAQKAKKLRNHKELKVEETHDNERFGRGTSSANAQQSAAGVKTEHSIVTIESSDDDADMSGTWNVKPVRHN